MACICGRSYWTTVFAKSSRTASKRATGRQRTGGRRRADHAPLPSGPPVAGRRAFVLPDGHLERVDVVRGDRQAVAEDASEVLDAGVQAGELGQLVERAVAIALDDRVERRVDGVDVDEVPVLVEARPLVARLDLVVMGVQLVLAAPVAADEEVLRDQVAPHRDAVARRAHRATAAARRSPAHEVAEHAPADELDAERAHVPRQPGIAQSLEVLDPLAPVGGDRAQLGRIRRRMRHDDGHAGRELLERALRALQPALRGLVERQHPEVVEHGQPVALAALDRAPATAPRASRAAASRARARRCARREREVVVGEAGVQARAHVRVDVRDVDPGGERAVDLRLDLGARGGAVDARPGVLVAMEADPRRRSGRSRDRSSRSAPSGSRPIRS